MFRAVVLWASTLILLKVAGDKNLEVKKLFSDFISWRFQENPEYGTAAGDYRNNDRISTFTSDKYIESKGKADEFLIRLEAINPDEITSESDRISFAVLKDMLNTYIDGFQWRRHLGLNHVHAVSSTTTDPTKIAAISPFDTAGDFENYLLRLEAYPQKNLDIITMSKEALLTGFQYHNVSISRVFDQIDVFLATPLTDNELFKPFTDRLQDLTARVNRSSLQMRGRKAVQSVYEAFRSLRLFLQQDYSPRTRKFYGVGGLPNGKEFYAACLRWYLSYNATPEEVHQTGLDEVARIEEKMKEIMANQGHNGTIKEYFNRLRREPSFFKRNKEELLKEYQSIMDTRIAPKLPDFFETIPETPVVVRPSKTDGVVGFYNRGSVDGSKPGIFYANVFRPQEQWTITNVALTLHEANPGHHLQIMLATQSDIPTFRRFYESSHGSVVPFLFPAYTAFIEGWALYAEGLGEEMGVYRDDYERIGRYASEMFRACRLVVDTGLHYYDWSRRTAIEYLLNYTAMTQTSIEIEVDRFLTIPGQACSYKIGELNILKARKRAEENLGDKFDIKKFHTTVLKNGAIPLDLLQKIVDEWVHDTLDASPHAACSSSSLYWNAVLTLSVALYALCRIV